MSLFKTFAPITVQPPINKMAIYVHALQIAIRAFLKLSVKRALQDII